MSGPTHPAGRDHDDLTWRVAGENSSNRNSSDDDARTVNDSSEGEESIPGPGSRGRGQIIQEHRGSKGKGGSPLILSSRRATTKREEKQPGNEFLPIFLRQNI